MDGRKLKPCTKILLTTKQLVRQGDLERTDWQTKWRSCVLHWTCPVGSVDMDGGSDETGITRVDEGRNLGTKVYPKLCMYTDTLTELTKRVEKHLLGHTEYPRVSGPGVTVVVQVVEWTRGRFGRCSGDRDVEDVGWRSVEKCFVTVARTPPRKDVVSF